jgi:hypothetical protein
MDTTIVGGSMRHSLTAGNDIVQIVECSATADEGWQYSFRRGAMIFAPAPGPRSWKSRQPKIVCCALMTTHNIGDHHGIGFWRLVSVRFAQAVHPRARLDCRSADFKSGCHGLRRKNSYCIPDTRARKTNTVGTAFFAHVDLSDFLDQYSLWIASQDSPARATTSDGCYRFFKARSLSWPI